MREPTPLTTVRTSARRAEGILALPGVLFAAVGLTLVVAYGNEIFNLHLTIDEEYFANAPMWRAWLGDGRWGMALLSGLLMPRSVSPVVSSVIGVLGVAAALHVFVSTWMTSRIARYAVVVFAGVFPALPYLFTFSTLSYGAGAGALAAAVAFRTLVRPGTVYRYIAVVGLYSFAVAVYQPLLFAFVVMTMVYVAAALLRGEPVRPLLVLLLQTAACAVGAVAVYLLVLRLARLATGVALSAYVSGQVDVAGFLADPWTRLSDSAGFVVSQLSAAPELFHGNARYVGPLLVLCLLALLASTAVRHGAAHGVLVVALVAGGLLFLTLVESATRAESDLRTLVHLPFLAAGIVGLGFQALLRMDPSRWSVAALAVAVGAATLGLVTDMNRLFFSTEILFERDFYLASRVDEELVRLGAPDPQVPLNFVLIGNRRQVEGPATPTRETIGTSFFEWDGGNPGRSAVFIRTVTGRDLRPVAPELAARVAAESVFMPVWPAEGGLRVEGDTAVLKLSEPTPEQRRLWCSLGSTTFCTA